MDRLSPEILYLIVAHLCKVPPPVSPIPGEPRISRAPYAILSRTWQSLVERWTLRFIKLRDTQIDTFAAIFAVSSRRTLLRQLLFIISLPTHGDSRDDFARNQAVFRSSILKLLNVLKDWDNVGARLKLHVALEQRKDLHFDVYKSSSLRRYLSLDAIELPTVQCVGSLNVVSRSGRAWHPRAMCQLAGTFPHLQALDLEVTDPVNKRRQMRKDHRLALAAGLTVLNLPKLTNLSIHRMPTTTVYNHSFECTDLREDGIDALNDALRKLSQTAPLTSLVLVGELISPDLFRNRRSTKIDLSTWPTLQNLTIKADIIAPSGSWYYTGDPDAVEPDGGFNHEDEDEDGDEGEDNESSDSDDDWDRDAVANGVWPSHTWRTRPDPDLFNKLVKDMASAVLRMPQLRTGTLDIGFRRGEPADITIKCAEATYAFNRRPDWKTDTDKEKSTRRWHAWVGEATEWEVPESVRMLWKEWLGDSGKSTVDRWSPTDPEIIEEGAS
ncbi:hypothetical protein F4805DRAFT_419812 [Annulohypoxylon moriforme]|nr:hypothetical protein F4805DRAFT_419812 [Annulohypoxylon moriforme]